MFYVLTNNELTDISLFTSQIQLGCTKYCTMYTIILFPSQFPSQSQMYIVLPSWHQPVHPHILSKPSGHLSESFAGKLKSILFFCKMLTRKALRGVMQLGFLRPTSLVPKRTFIHRTYQDIQVGGCSTPNGEVNIFPPSPQAAGMVKVMPSGTCESRRYCHHKDLLFYLFSRYILKNDGMGFSFHWTVTNPPKNILQTGVPLCHMETRPTLW